MVWSITLGWSKRGMPAPRVELSYECGKRRVNEEKLVAAGVSLRRHKNQPGPNTCWLWLRGARASLKNSDDNGIGGNNSDGNGSDDGRTKDQRHKERNHNRPPCFESAKNSATQFLKTQLPQNVPSIRCRQAELRLWGFFNLPAVAPAASDHPDS